MARSYLQNVNDESQVAEARRTAASLARQHGLTDEAVSDVSIIVTEAATNLVKHAREGQLIFRALEGDRGLGFEVLSIDKGPGIQDLNKALADGYSTAGTPGNGLGAIRRRAEYFDIYTKVDEGTLILAEVWNPANSQSAGRRSTGPLVGLINLPIKGEEVCGDSWAVHSDAGRTSVLVIDGLGHGGPAAEASRIGVEAFNAEPMRSAVDQVQVLHGALKPTRGAAAAVAVIDHGRQVVEYCGIGNVAGVIVQDGVQRHLVSHNGTMGHDAKVRGGFTYPWASDALLVMASDGLTTRWSLSTRAPLTAKHPGIVAAALYRDHCRGRDDVTVLVVAMPRGGAA